MTPPLPPGTLLGWAVKTWKKHTQTPTWTWLPLPDIRAARRAARRMYAKFPPWSLTLTLYALVRSPTGDHLHARWHTRNTPAWRHAVRF